MPELPDFQTDKEFIDWFHASDLSDYMDDLEETETIPVNRTLSHTRPIDLQMRSEDIAAIASLAEKRGIPFQLLVHEWVLDRLHLEQPELLPAA